MHKNNFDFLRLVFALFVVITHSIPLSGSSSLDPLQYLTAKQFSLSDVALAGFFTLSGYLVFESLKRTSSLFSYYKNRILRIYPGLILALIVTLIVGAIVTNQNVKEYFGDRSTAKYLLLNLSMFCERPHFLKGVFATNPYNIDVNGSLWTIQYEFIFYVFLSSLFFARKKPSFCVTIPVVVYVIALIIYYGKDTLIPGYLYYYIKMPIRSYDYDYFFIFGFYFCAGVIISNCKAIFYIYKTSLLMMSGAMLLAVFIFNQTFLPAIRLTFPVLVISFGMMQTKWINNLSEKIGDFSYGIYIYGFLIQQALIFYFKLDYPQLVLATIPIAITLGFLSWRYVEEPFLKLKSKRRVQVSAQVALFNKLSR